MTNGMETGTPTEIPTSVDHGASGTDGDKGALYQNLFNSPVDFLTTLKQALQHEHPADPDNITQEELLSFARSNKDPKQQQAEEIAASHFEPLKRLSELDQLPNNAGLSLDKITDDINLASGNTKPVTDEEVQKWHDNAFGDLGLAATAAVGGFAAVEVPPLSGLAFAFGAFALFGAGVEEIAALTAKGGVIDKAKEDQQILATWPEVNR